MAKNYFLVYDCTRILGDIDFCVSIPNKSPNIFGMESFLWAEAKKEKDTIITSIVQLILTIGKARTFDSYLPPAFVGSFDTDEIGMIPYNKIHEIFYINDFNWKVPPSNHNTKEFKIIYEKVITILNKDFVIFKLGRDDKEIKKYIKSNFILGKTKESKIRIDKNNFIVIYNKWLQVVKPTIAVNWDIAKISGLIDGDFYLADLLSKENNSLKDKLFVLLRNDHYVLDRHIEDSGMFSSKRTNFNDNQVAHIKFWNKYERPPKKEYWDYIVERHDLLVPQDIRERQGSYFTPQIWVELSQQYISDVLGEGWQDEYYIWDCAAGTGNLLHGLTNKYNIWASTRDKPDVEVMHDRIENGANLLDDHVFKFNFLDDDFNTLPTPLQNIINDEEKRKKLIIFINPPYAEATSSKTISSTDSLHKKDVDQTKTKEKYKHLLNQASKELSVQFIFRIYKELKGVYIANFSKVKTLQGNHYKEFRKHFIPKLEKMFIVPSYTFDNVKGKFPIGFFIWNTQFVEKFASVNADVYDADGYIIGQKTMFVPPDKNIKDWLRKYSYNKDSIGYLVRGSADVQNNNVVFVTLKPSQSVLDASNSNKISKDNLLENAVFLSVRKVIEQTWINDRDQYLYPNSTWENDETFKNDCLAFILFDQSNTVKSSDGKNQWIPFTENEVNSREKFDSNFMSQYLLGKITATKTDILFKEESIISNPLVFSQEAQEVFTAGKELWKYYHSIPKCNVNASLYDIREYFQGRNETGKMNNKSTDEKYSNLISNLRDALILLSHKIEPKVYEHNFLTK